MVVANLNCQDILIDDMSDLQQRPSKSKKKSF